MVKHALIRLAEWLCSRVKFIRCVRGGLSGGLVPVLPVFRPERSEHVRSGADNRCYGKSTLPAALWLPCKGVFRLLSFILCCPVLVNFLQHLFLDPVPRLLRNSVFSLQPHGVRLGSNGFRQATLF